MKTPNGTIQRFFTLLLALALLMGSPASLLAEVSPMSPCQAEASPFYEKLRAADVFSIAIETPAGEPKPIKLLFLMARNFHYSWDPLEKEQWQNAEQTTRNFSGACADKAIWLYTHLRRNGYRNVELVIGRYSPSSKVLHMWVTRTDENGDRMLLDPTIQKRIWKENAFPKNFYRPVFVVDGEHCRTIQ